jgi:Mg/Co/Ni transporter MgtE
MTKRRNMTLGKKVLRGLALGMMCTGVILIGIPIIFKTGVDLPTGLGIATVCIVVNTYISVWG